MANEARQVQLVGARLNASSTILLCSACAIQCSIACPLTCAACYATPLCCSIGGGSGRQAQGGAARYQQDGGPQRGLRGAGLLNLRRWRLLCLL